MEELPTMKPENLQSNMKIIYYCRTFMSIIGGVMAGILGLTSWMGFVFYFLVMGITSAGLAAKAGFSIHSYFDSWNRILLDGVFSGLMVSFFCLFLANFKAGMDHDMNNIYRDMHRAMSLSILGVSFDDNLLKETFDTSFAV